MSTNKRIQRAVKAIESSGQVQSVKATHTPFSMGLTLLNLAITGKPDIGAFGGTVVNIIGGESIGKTLVTLTALADIANNPKLDHVQLYYDDAEHANDFNLKSVFGEKLAAKLQPPRIVDGAPAYSTTVEELKDNIFRLSATGKQFVYVLDSLDALTCDAEMAKAEEDMERRESGGEIKGSFGGGKPKGMSELFRQCISKLSECDSLLFIISQVRDNVNAGLYGKKEVVTGGRALGFYASTRIWMTLNEKIKVALNGHDRIIGNHVKFKITKNKSTGKESESFFKSYYSYGADEVGTNVDYLIYEKVWEKKGAMIDTNGFITEPVKSNAIIKLIEDSNAQLHLRGLVHKTWIDIEEKLKVDRKPRWS